MPLLNLAASFWRNCTVFDEQMIEMLWEGVIDTLYMTIASTALSYVFGMIMGVLLVICRKDGIAPRPNSMPASTWW